MIVCPECGEGTILRWRVAETGGEVYFCDEEFSLWLRREDIGTRAVGDLDAYLNSHGLRGNANYDALEMVQDLDDPTGERPCE